MAKTLEQLEAENRKQREIIKQQATALKVAEATAPKNAKPIVTIDGEPYKLLAGERGFGEPQNRSGDQVSKMKRNEICSYRREENRQRKNDRILFQALCELRHIGLNVKRPDGTPPDRDR